MKPTGAALFLACLFAAACGPSVSNSDDQSDDDSADVDAGPNGPCVVSGDEGTVETCSDSVDQDCDGLYDCQDPDCSGVGECPVCGEVDTSEGAGIPLPDGISSGTACVTNADCTAATPNCVESECHASYTSTLNVVGFGDNQVFDNADIIQSICINAEHSWLRDMEIRLIAPGGQIVRLQKFLGRTGGEIYLGAANDCDSASSPVAGTGAQYCWSPTATNQPMLDYANGGGAMSSVNNCYASTSSELPAGTYAAADAWTLFDGSSLNGQWQLVVTDLWGADNGFIFDWTISFDPQAVGDCSGPIVN